MNGRIHWTSSHIVNSSNMQNCLSNMMPNIQYNVYSKYKIFRPAVRNFFLESATQFCKMLLDRSAIYTLQLFFPFWVRNFAILVRNFTNFDRNFWHIIFANGPVRNLVDNCASASLKITIIADWKKDRSAPSLQTINKLRKRQVWKYLIYKRLNVLFFNIERAKALRNISIS